MKPPKKEVVLRDHINKTLRNYLANLDGHNPTNLYGFVLREVEIPLIKQVLEYTQNNQTIAAKMLGISRGTLRKKIHDLKII